MKSYFFLFVALVAVLGPGTPSADACTTFRMNGDEGPLVGKTYDWHSAEGRLVWNPAGLAKRGLLIVPGDRPAEWTSRHASATFVQYGRDLPNGGMNQAGLVIEILWLSAATDIVVDARPAVNELQWIQMQLDLYRTVGEVVAAAESVRISRIHARVHYLVCDATGACAAVEPLDGRLHITTGTGLDVPVLANQTYAEGLQALQQCAGFGGSAPIGRSNSSAHRFARAAKRVQHAGTRDDAFGLLDAVAQGSTQWQIVYVPTRREIAFRTAASREIKRLAVSTLDPSCKRPALSIDIDHKAGGSIDRALGPWSIDDNRQLVFTTYPALATRGAPKGLIEFVAGMAAAHPVDLRCTTP